jgi:hypothetical protein
MKSLKRLAMMPNRFSLGDQAGFDDIRHWNGFLYLIGG